MHEILIEKLQGVNNDYPKDFLPKTTYESIIEVLQQEYLGNLLEIEGNLELINRSIEAVEKEFPNYTEDENRKILEFSVDQVAGKPCPKAINEQYGRAIALTANVLRKIGEVQRLKGANEYTLNKVNKLKELSQDAR